MYEAVTLSKNHTPSNLTTVQTSGSEQRGYLPLHQIECNSTLRAFAQLIDQGDQRLLHLVTQYLRSHRLKTRLRAVKLLSYVQDKAAQRALAQRLEFEQNVRLLRAILKSLGQQQLTEVVLEQVFMTAKTSFHPDLRLAAIEALANQAFEFPQVKRYLAELYSLELDRENADTILRRITA